MERIPPPRPFQTLNALLKPDHKPNLALHLLLKNIFAFLWKVHLICCIKELRSRRRPSENFVFFLLPPPQKYIKLSPKWPGRIDCGLAYYLLPSGQILKMPNYGNEKLHSTTWTCTLYSNIFIGKQLTSQ